MVEWLRSLTANREARKAAVILLAILAVIAFAVGLATSIVAGIAFAGDKWPFDIGGFLGSLVSVGVVFLAVHLEGRARDREERERKKEARSLAVEALRSHASVLFIKGGSLIEALLQRQKDPTPERTETLRSAVLGMGYGWLQDETDAILLSNLAPLPPGQMVVIHDGIRGFRIVMRSLVKPIPISVIGQDETDDAYAYRVGDAVRHALNGLHNALKHLDQVASTIEPPPADPSGKNVERIEQAMMAITKAIDS